MGDQSQHLRGQAKKNGAHRRVSRGELARLSSRRRTDQRGVWSFRPDPQHVVPVPDTLFPAGIQLLERQEPTRSTVGRRRGETRT